MLFVPVINCTLVIQAVLITQKWLRGGQSVEGQWPFSQG